jgi:YqaJ-like viral recombinase domain
MTGSELAVRKFVYRRTFIGGSDARVIMGDDEAALLRLWRQKRGEVEPEDLSGNLTVQLGVVTEPLNRLWYERNTGQAVTDVQRRIRHPVNRWMGATLDTASTLPVLLASRARALPQAHTGAATVLANELDARSLESSSNCVDGFL